METPKAPKIDKKIMREIGQGSRRVSKLPCRKLSSELCKTNPNCIYSKSDEICMPRYTFSEKNEQVQSYEEFYFESLVKWRVGIADLIKDINIFDIIENISIISKSSASKSIIITGKIKPVNLDRIHSKFENIIVKLSFYHDDSFNNSLETEIAIYRNIITNLINNKHTPNLIAYLGDFNYSIDAIKNVPNIGEHLDSINEDTEEDDDQYDTSSCNILVLERSKSGYTFNDWLETHGEDGIIKRSEQDILGVIFQILYTLVCFYNIGLVHNDLHFDNIFIEDMERPITMFFMRGDDKFIQLTTRYIPKIYDFDRGSIIHKGVPLNLEIDKDYCKNYGTCNFFNAKFDSFYFITELLYNGLQLGGVSPEIRINIRNNWISKITDSKWYLPTKNKESGKFLPYTEQPTDQQFNNPIEILSKFLYAKWDDPPFKDITAILYSLPRELVYIPPNQTKLSITYYYPTSNDTHPSYVFNDSFYSRRRAILASSSSQLLVVWDNMLKLISKYNYNEKGISLYNKFMVKKFNEAYIPNTRMKDWYTKACQILMIPMYHMLSKKDQIVFIGIQNNDSVAMKNLIDDVWNVFNNTLPEQTLNISRVD